MSVTDFVLIAIGEMLLMAVFAFGILVGVSMKPRRGEHDGDSNKGTKEACVWHQVERR
jgi:hypothetical protein